MIRIESRDGMTRLFEVGAVHLRAARRGLEVLAVTQSAQTVGSVTIGVLIILCDPVLSHIEIGCSTDGSPFFLIN